MVINYTDGQVLTAGSLLSSMTQFYGTSDYFNGVAGSPNILVESGTNPTSIGSIFVSGNSFNKSLFVEAFGLSRNNGTSAFIGNQFLISGAGLGGGSVVGRYSFNANTADATVPYNYINRFVFSSGAGWIPGSDAVIFYQIASDDIGTNLQFSRVNITVYGNG